MCIFLCNYNHILSVSNELLVCFSDTFISQNVIYVRDARFSISKIALKILKKNSSNIPYSAMFGDLALSFK